MMDIAFGDCRFESSSVNDVKQGCTGLELHRTQQGERIRVASVLFWDASGQFSVETFGTDVPLEVLENLIAEAKESVIC